MFYSALRCLAARFRGVRRRVQQSNTHWLRSDQFRAPVQCSRLGRQLLCQGRRPSCEIVGPWEREPWLMRVRRPLSRQLYWRAAEGSTQTRRPLRVTPPERTPVVLSRLPQLVVRKWADLVTVGRASVEAEQLRHLPLALVASNRGCRPSQRLACLRDGRLNRGSVPQHRASRGDTFSATAPVSQTSRTASMLRRTSRTATSIR